MNPTQQSTKTLSIMVTRNVFQASGVAVRGMLMLATVSLLALAGCTSPDPKESATQQQASADNHKGDDHDHKEPTSHAAEATEPEHTDEHGHDEHDQHDHGHEQEAITLTAAAMNEAGIVVQAAQRQAVSLVVDAPGRVIPSGDGIAHVGPVIPGRITKLFVSEGRSVKAGTPLAEMEAFDVGSLKGEYLRARAELVKAEATVTRQRQLAKEGIGVTKSLEEAEAAWRLATASLKSAETRLRAIGISTEKLSDESTFSSRILLRSPINGVVARQQVVLGEYVDPSKDAFHIINTRIVWVDAQVPPAVAGDLRTGGAGFVSDADAHRHAGRIIFIAPTVDPSSRTVTVRLAIDNPDVHLRPETFVAVQFERAATAGYAVSIPAEAVEQQQGAFFVYREQKPGAFERVEIQVELPIRANAIVRGGISVGDRIATKGVFYLKSQRQKGELQEHSH
ncbi:MAG: efflux RND transporter periplasmic adaptor subunit [Armatimonadetes bacterium]|nr:efflux RND transporter periplasmic adaptor subunit [Armatimonadota bacterium]